jgi:hypothetical protein
MVGLLIAFTAITAIEGTVHAANAAKPLSAPTQSYLAYDRAHDGLMDKFHLKVSEALPRTKVGLRAASALVAAPDSMIIERYDTLLGAFVNDRKHVMVSHSNGILDENATYLWNTVLGQWVLNMRYSATGVNTGFPLVIEYIYRNPNTGELISAQKQVNVYDANNNLLETSYYLKMSDAQEYFPQAKNTYTYNEKQQMTSYANLSWNAGLQDWAPNSKTELTLDSQGNELMNVSSNYDYYSASWVYSNKTASTYDAQGKPLTVEVNQWNAGTSDWAPYSHTVSTYNSEGMPLEVRYYNADGSGSYVLKGIDTHAYNSYGDFVLYEKKELNESTGLLMVTFREETTWEAQQRMAQMISWYWNRTDGLLVSGNKSEYTYAPNGHPNLIKYSDWDLITSTWVLNDQYEYTFDANGYEIGSRQSQRNEDTNTMEYTYRCEITVDADGRTLSNTAWAIDPVSRQLVADSKYETTYDDDHLVQQTTSWKWIPQTGSWRYYERTTQYQSLRENNAVVNIESKSLRLYPNPATDRIVLQGIDGQHPATIEIFDANGKRQLRTQTISNEVRLGRLPSGTYLLRVTPSNRNPETLRLNVVSGR